MPTTRNKHITNFRRFLNIAKEDGMHNLDVTTIFKDQKVYERKEDKKIEVYLTEEEIDALYHAELTGRLALSRDIFLIGCYTAQGFADVSNLCKGNLVGEDKSVVALNRQKTGTRARIPLDLKYRLGNNVRTILKRYDYDIKSLKVYAQKVNDDIKAILQSLSTDVPSLAELCVTQLSKTEKRLEESGKRTFTRTKDGEVIKPKYECVSTHTARRSGITNLVLTKNYDLFAIQQIAGHSSQEQTEHYIKLSGADIEEFLNSNYGIK